MASPYPEDRRASPGVDGFLLALDGRDGFAGATDGEGVAVGDAGQNPPGEVGPEAGGGDGVVGLAAGHGGNGESRADLYTLHRADAHEGLGQIGIHLVEDGFPQTGGTARNMNLHNASQGISAPSGLFQAGRHDLGRLRIRAAQGIDVQDREVRPLCYDAPQGPREGCDPDTLPGEDFPCHGPCGYPGGCFPS